MKSRCRPIRSGRATASVQGAGAAGCARGPAACSGRPAGAAARTGQRRLRGGARSGRDSAPSTTRASRPGGAAGPPRRQAERHALDRRRRPGRLRHRLGAGRTGLAQHVDRPRRSRRRWKARATRPVCSTASSTRRTVRMPASTAPPRCWRSARCKRAIDSGVVRGSAQGLLRLDTRGLGVQALRDELAALALAAAAMCRRSMPPRPARAAALPLQHPAWFYPGGGWVQPAALATWFLQQAGALAEFRGGLQGAVAARRRGPLAAARRHRPGRRRSRHRRAGQCRRRLALDAGMRIGRCNRCAARSACTAPHRRTRR